MPANTKTVYLQWHNIPFELIEIIFPVSQIAFTGHATLSLSAGVLLCNIVLWHGHV